MRKIILPLVIAVTSLSVHVNAQVGVNTQTPASTLDVRAKETTGTSAVVEGLLIPRVDRQKALSMTGVPVSTMIYISSTATGAQTGTAVNIDAEGYYYFNGTAWTKLAGNGTPANNIYTNDGTLAGNRIVTQGANTLAFTGTSVNAFSVDGSTLSVDAANDRVGINTTAPGTTLDVNGAITNRETSIAVSANTVSIPANTSQIQLTGAATADVTVTAPAAPNAGQRLIVYNNTTGDFGAILNGNTVLNGQAVEFIYSNGAWRTTDNGASNPTVPVSNFWRLNGNAGTIPANNFIGTTNNVGFAIRTNNTERMRITNNGNIGIGTTAPTGIVNIVADNKGNGAGNDFYFDGYGTSTNPVIFLGSAGGTAAIPTNLTNGTIIGGYVFKPRVNGNWQFISSGMYSNYVGDGTNNLTNLRFATSGSDRVTIDQTGNVGIGTSTPGTTLDVNGAITNRETSITVSANSATVPANVSQIQLTGAASAGVTITAPAAPNAGQRLIVYNNTTGGFDAAFSGNIILNGQAIEFIYSNGSWRTTDNGASNPLAASNNWRNNGNTGTNAATNFIGTIDNTAFVTRTNNIERIRLTPGGFLGMGTSAPAGILNVVTDNQGGGAANDYLFDGYGNSSEPALFLGTSGGTAAAPTAIANGTLTGGLYFRPRTAGGWQYTSAGINSRYLGDGTSNLTNLTFFTSNASRMTIDQTGNVGIGNTAPNAPLQFANTVVNRKIVLYESVNNDNQFHGFGVGASVLRYQVGETGSDHVFYAGTGTATSNELFRIKGTGGAVGVVTTPSDIRLKKDIVDNAYGLKEILNLRTINYRFKDEARGKDKKIGFIAQEIKAAMPELVATANDDMKTLSVNYPEMTVVLTKAVQELQELVKSQQKQIDELKAQIRPKP